MRAVTTSLLVAVTPTAAAATAAHGAEAIRAVDRLVTAWHEWYLGVFAAVGAHYLGHDALATAVATATTVAAISAIAITIAAAVARRFLGCAAIGTANRLSIALLRVKFLLTFGKGKRRTAIAAR